MCFCIVITLYPHIFPYPCLYQSTNIFYCIPVSCPRTLCLLKLMSYHIVSLHFITTPLHFSSCFVFLPVTSFYQYLCVYFFCLYRRQCCMLCAEFSPRSPWASMKSRKYDWDTWHEHTNSLSHTTGTFHFLFSTYFVTISFFFSFNFN